MSTFDPIDVVITIESAREMDDMRAILEHIRSAHGNRYNQELVEKLLPAFTRL